MEIQKKAPKKKLFKNPSLFAKRNNAVTSLTEEEEERFQQIFNANFNWRNYYHASLTENENSKI